MKLEMSSSDIVKAFNHSPYTKEKPQYTKFDEVMVASGEEEYYGAKKTGCGLPEASRLWYNGYDDVMISTSNTRSVSDMCL